MSDIAKYYVETAVQNAPKHTGRVPDVAEPPMPFPFLLHKDTGEKPLVEYKDQALVRVHVATPLNQLFFSEKNVKYLQDEIRYHIWSKSNGQHVIDPQNPDDLKIIMRSYYLQYAGNDPTRVKEELDNLNSRVLTYCVNYIMGEINMYLYYRKDVSDFPEPIIKPMNANVTGTKSAEFKSFF